MEHIDMPILLWVVVPFAIWSACFGQAEVAPIADEKPREFGGG
jgi:hypothetical protein